MKIINAGYEIMTAISPGGIEELKFIERVGRTCYKSEDKITEDGESAKRFVRMLIEKGHEAMLEHSILTVRFIVDRGVSHEIVRHRIASFAQESTRYCNYSKDKFGNEITVVKPYTIQNDTEFAHWWVSCAEAEKVYFDLLNYGATPQIARSVLPNSLKTELIMTANYREWRNFFRLRTAKAAHPQMREVAVPLLNELKERIPVVFEDIATDE